MNNEEYHSSPGVSKSGLALVSKCPALYKSRYIDGIGSEQTKAMLIGSATHKAVLEPHDFDKEFVCAPDINRRTKAGKEEWSQFQEDNRGKDVLSTDEFETVMEISESVKSHPVASQILKGGIAETSLFHQDNQTGNLVKVRPDWITEDLVVDLKTSTDASPEAFSKACFNFTYHMQAAMYLDVAANVMDIQLNSFVFIVVEKNPPYQVAVYYADSDMIKLGHAEYRAALELYSKCKADGEWPGYNANQITSIGLPAWAYK